MFEKQQIDETLGAAASSPGLDPGLGFDLSLSLSLSLSLTHSDAATRRTHLHDMMPGRPFGGGERPAHVGPAALP